MGKMRVNFAEVEGSFDPLPEGQYEVQVERVEVRESNSSDNDYLNWEMVVTEEGEFEGRKLWMITSLSQKAMFRLKDVLVEIGVIEPEDEIDIEWEDDVDILPGEGPLVVFPELEGINAVAHVINQIYEGKERNRVDNLTDGNGRASSPPPVKKSSTKKSGAAAKKTGGRQRKLR